jgi:hypothetical protein
MDKAYTSPEAVRALEGLARISGGAYRTDIPEETPQEALEEVVAAKVRVRLAMQASPKSDTTARPSTCTGSKQIIT